MEMTKDCNYEYKNQYKKLYQCFRRVKSVESAEPFQGIIRIFEDRKNLQGEERTMQESHNANHVLYYLSLISYAITTGMKKDWANQSKCQRIFAHLQVLSEFVREDDLQLTGAIAELTNSFAVQNLDSQKKWALFMLENWTCLKILAARYSNQPDSFSDEEKNRIGDVISLRKFFCGWWWCQRLSRMTRQIVKQLKRNSL